MIYIDYLGKYNSFIGTLEGDTWKITSINCTDSSKEEHEKDSYKIKIQHYMITVEITSELGKSVKFDIDAGYTSTIYNPQKKGTYYISDLKTSNYEYLKIGSSKRNVIIYKSDDDDSRFTYCKKLVIFLKDEMHLVTDYFNKVEKIEKKKESIEKDFE